MKVAIVTITDGSNYGNRLQNYALQESLKKLGVECETIQRVTSRDPSIIRKTGALCKDILRVLGGRRTNRVYRVRKKRFHTFNHRNIVWSKYVLQNNKAPKSLKNAYHFFICGSDQIWNVKFDVVKEDILNYLASFADPAQRIAYAASFGTTEVDDEQYIGFFKEELPKFKAISVREQSGIPLVAKLCGQNAQLVLDPTMLISAQEWNQLSVKPDCGVEDDECFVLTYFMSGRNDTINKYIENVKKQFVCCKVINLEMEFRNRDSIENEKVFCTTPDEFIWLISHASVVLTDSFHGTVFSILFHKPFCVFQRKTVECNNNIESRLDTLLKYFDLERFRDDLNNPRLSPETYDANVIEGIIESKRQASFLFLKRALNLEG